MPRRKPKRNIDQEISRIDEEINRLEYSLGLDDPASRSNKSERVILQVPENTPWAANHDRGIVMRKKRLVVIKNRLAVLQMIKKRPCLRFVPVRILAMFVIARIRCSMGGLRIHNSYVSRRGLLLTQGCKMQKHFSTRQVAIDILKCNPDTLSKAIWKGKVTAPPKSPGNQYLWEIRHIESAAWAMGRFENFKIWEGQRED